MKTVLVVDDFASVRFFHLTLLKGAGYLPLAARDGAEALRLLDQHPIDLVMLDLQMPAMGGGEFLQRIRANSRHTTLPVLIVTSDPSPDHAARLATDRACRVLQKPVLPAALLQAIGGCLN